MQQFTVKKILDKITWINNSHYLHLSNTPLPWLYINTERTETIRYLQFLQICRNNIIYTQVGKWCGNNVQTLTGSLLWSVKQSTNLWPQFCVAYLFVQWFQPLGESPIPARQCVGEITSVSNYLRSEWMLHFVFWIFLKSKHLILGFF